MRVLNRSILAGCAALCFTHGVNAADAPANTKATLIFYDASGNQSLDPAETQSTSGLAQLPLIAIYDSLVGLSDTGVLRSRLATSWKYNQDLTEFTLTLRKGATFHDGT